MDMPVRVRYAPSPTGEPHLGNIRTALFDWLLARHEGGQFILRIEDTDQARYAEESVGAQMEALHWLGLDWDEGPDIGGPFAPYVQSERLEIYREHAERLIDNDRAYRCYCSTERLDRVRKELQARKQPPRYDRYCRSLTPDERATAEATGVAPVVRFKTPLDGETVTVDALRGDVTFQNDTLDDFVILKSAGFPTYHLASIVDDHLMEITHVLRGDEWLSSAPRHQLVYEAFGWDPPVFAHLSRILGPDKAKLSKRHGAHSVLHYREQGYLPDALINFLGLLGWSLDDRTEIISREEFVSHFDLSRALTNPAVFNAEKLDWMNGVYIRAMNPEEFAEAARPFLERAVGRTVDMGRLMPIMPLLQERVKLLSEIGDMADFFFVEGALEYTVESLLGKKFAEQPDAAAVALTRVAERVESVADWKHEALEAAIRPLAEELEMKAGPLFGLVRVAVTGRSAAPPLFETMAVLGREIVVERLNDALKRLPPNFS
ncbi:MAG: glutamate--tRNA ligase [Chloroflexi bacterium]|nr:glutamate--tRNA ligase [Chloroflexota bacterium]